MIFHWLVVWPYIGDNHVSMEFYDFPYIGNILGIIIIPTDALHDFSEGWRKTTNQQ